MKKSPLYTYKKNVHSQNGEDGIIEEILRRLDILDSQTPKWAVDVGAWDGVHLSNVFHLVEKYNWNAVMIEGDFSKCVELRNLSRIYSGVIPVESYVGQYDTSDNSLHSILSKTPIPKNFDLLSIDIDSYDSDVWETLRDYCAKIVIIETNSGVGPEVLFRHVDPPPGEISRGTSFAEMQKIAEFKGYKLVCYTGNCIYVRDDLYCQIENGLSPTELFQAQYRWS